MSKIALIVGAGPAGLTAAIELLERTEYKPILIEADNQVGGLSKTIDYKGNKIDIGGHRFFSKSDKVINWWLKFLPIDQSQIDKDLLLSYQQKQVYIHTSKEGGSNPEEMMLIRPRKSRIYFQRKLFDYPIRANIKTFRLLGAHKTLKILTSYTYSRINPRKKEVNLEDFMINRFGKELYLTFFKNYTEKVWGVPCQQIPADWGHQRIKDLNISELIRHSIRSIFKKNKKINQTGTSTSLIEQFLYPSKGPGQLWDKVADQIREKGGEIILNSYVKNIQFSACGLPKSVTYISQKSELTVPIDCVFSTMPVKNLIAGIQGIKIPESIRHTADQLQYRDFIIVGILCSELALKEKNGDDVSDNWIYIQDDGFKAGRLQFFHNWSPYMVAKPDQYWLGVEFFTNYNDNFWNLSEEEIRTLAIQEMVKAGIINHQSVLDSAVFRIEKAYPSYHGAYKDFQPVQDWLNTVSGLYLTGRNGLHRYNNSDHSMLTAMAAVDALISGDPTDKEKIWLINAEDAYHEEK